MTETLPPSIVQPPKENLINKLGYFFAGVITGAVALGVAAFVVDEHAGSSSSDDPDTEEEGETESAATVTSPSSTIEPEESAPA